MTHNVLTRNPGSVAVFSGSALSIHETPGLFLGRAYRAYREFTGATVLKLTSTTSFLLTAQRLYVDTGQARATITIGSTPTGSLAALPTKFSKNGTVSPVPTPTVTVEVLTGTVAGGTEREVLRVNAGGGAGAVSNLDGYRVLPAGTYWISIGVTGSTSGVYSIEYEELT